MDGSRHEIRELLAAARGGAALYRRAQARVADVRLRALFAEYARTRDRLAAEFAAAAGEPGAGGRDTAGRWLRTAYTDWLTRRGPDRDAAWIAELEEAEDALLDAIEDALDGGVPPGLRALLAARLPEVRAGHDRMRALKRTRH